MLPCNHNFCQQCIQKIIDNKALAIKNSRNGGKRFKCPACRREVVIDMHGVHALPRNLVVEQLIEKIDLISLAPAPTSVTTPDTGRPASTGNVSYVGPLFVTREESDEISGDGNKATSS